MLFVSLVVSFIEDFKEDFNGKEGILKASHTKKKIITLFLSETFFEKIRVVIFYFVCEAYVVSLIFDKINKKHRISLNLLGFFLISLPY